MDDWELTLSRSGGDTKALSMLAARLPGGPRLRLSGGRKGGSYGRRRMMTWVQVIGVCMIAAAVIWNSFDVLDLQNDARELTARIEALEQTDDR